MKNALKEEDSHTLQSVLTLFNDINIFAPNQLSILEWNKVCWFGSLLAGMQDKTKHLENLSSACEKVVTNEQDPNYYYFLDTKAVFMALKGDFTQAEKYFEEVYRASSSRKIYYNEDREKEYEKRLTLLQNNQLAQRKNILLDFFNQSNWKCYVTYENKDIPSDCKNNSVQVSTIKKY
ncbi:MAG: hypothetical protein HC874_19325 [Richelia sp. SL_2_1]|nr:hypothetical protein [Richelia sp. SM1_7_0]NJN11790.1 hypothetical protein [Richelia sp. RM1_1_1]NJO29449.1 hypothetical protein [Richelia sp. SL_2_1]